mmetsp:Transcript_12658/g.34167  ORF Transcript_12658/g.34167 Transcript_12658/m.34167 type:complete len:304 (-) Transcript_12658:657-1568(-)
MLDERECDHAYVRVALRGRLNGDRHGGRAKDHVGEPQVKLGQNRLRPRTPHPGGHAGAHEDLEAGVHGPAQVRLKADDCGLKRLVQPSVTTRFGLRPMEGRQQKSLGLRAGRTNAAEDRRCVPKGHALHGDREDLAAGAILGRPLHRERGVVRQLRAQAPPMLAVVGGPVEPVGNDGRPHGLNAAVQPVQALLHTGPIADDFALQDVRMPLALLVQSQDQHENHGQQGGLQTPLPSSQPPLPKLELQSLTGEAAAPTTQEPRGKQRECQKWHQHYHPVGRSAEKGLLKQAPRHPLHEFGPRSR